MGLTSARDEVGVGAGAGVGSFLLQGQFKVQLLTGRQGLDGAEKAGQSLRSCARYDKTARQEALQMLAN